MADKNAGQLNPGPGPAGLLTAGSAAPVAKPGVRKWTMPPLGSGKAPRRSASAVPAVTPPAANPPNVIDATATQIPDDPAKAVPAAGPTAADASAGASAGASASAGAVINILNQPAPPMSDEEKARMQAAAEAAARKKLDEEQAAALKAEALAAQIRELQEKVAKLVDGLAKGSKGLTKAAITQIVTENLREIDGLQKALGVSQTELKGDVEKLKADLEKVAKGIDALLKQTPGTPADVQKAVQDAIDAKLRAVTKSMADLEAKCEADAKKHTAQVKDVKDLLLAYGVKQGEIDQRLTNVKTAVDGFVTQLGTMSTTLTNQGASITNLQTQVTGLGTTVGANHTALSGQISAIATAVSTLVARPAAAPAPTPAPAPAHGGHGAPPPAVPPPGHGPTPAPAPAGTMAPAAATCGTQATTVTGANATVNVYNGPAGVMAQLAPWQRVIVGIVTALITLYFLVFLYVFLFGKPVSQFQRDDQPFRKGVGSSSLPTGDFEVQLASASLDETSYEACVLDDGIHASETSRGANLGNDPVIAFHERMARENPSVSMWPVGLAYLNGCVVRVEAGRPGSKATTATQLLGNQGAVGEYQVRPGIIPENFAANAAIDLNGDGCVNPYDPAEARKIALVHFRRLYQEMHKKEPSLNSAQLTIASLGRYSGYTKKNLEKLQTIEEKQDFERKALAYFNPVVVKCMHGTAFTSLYT